MSNRNYFMTDFAASSRRNFLAGNSLRAKSFNGFAAMASLVGRGDRAAADYKAISRLLFKRRHALVRIARRIGHGSVAVVGLAAGVALYLAL